MRVFQVTSRKDQGQYWFDKQQPYKYVTVRNFVEKFKQFHAGKQLAGELASSFDKSKGHPSALVFNKYGLSNMGLFRANWDKEWLLMKRNTFVYVFKGIQASVLAQRGLRCVSCRGLECVFRKHCKLFA